MAPLSTRTIVWHTVKTFLFWKFYKASRAHFKTQRLAFLSIASLLSGTVIYRIIDAIVDRILCYLLNLETMSVFDEFFMNYKEGKPPNVLGMTTFARFDFDYMKKYLIGKVE